MRNSGVMSVFVEADIFIRVCNVDQSVASSPLTPTWLSRRVCVTRVFLTWLTCAVTFLFAFILDLHVAKILQCCTVQHSGVSIIQQRIESCS